MQYYNSQGWARGADVSGVLPLRTPGSTQAAVSARTEVNMEVPSTPDGGFVSIKPGGAGGHLGTKAWSANVMVYPETAEAHPAAMHGMHINNKKIRGGGNTGRQSEQYVSPVRGRGYEGARLVVQFHQCVCALTHPKNPGVWLKTKWYKERKMNQGLRKETWDPKCLWPQKRRDFKPTS